MLKLNIWIVRLAWLCCTLGITGAILIFYIGVRDLRNEGTPFSSPAVQQPRPAPVKADSAPIDQQPSTVPRNTTERDNSAPASSIVNPVDNRRSVATSVPESGRYIEATPPRTEATAKQETPPVQNPPVPKPEKNNEKEEKILDQQDLSQIVAQINETRDRNGIWGNCVQINRTRSGNNKRAAAQLEMYLRAKNYAIAGREEINGSVSGISITDNGNCIRIVIGSF